MHSLTQLPVNPVAQSHILIFITAQEGILTSTSHGVFPPIPYQSVSAFIGFIHLFVSPKFVKQHDDRHDNFVTLYLRLLLLSNTHVS